MVITQHRSKRKNTGGRYKKLYRSKKLYESGNQPTSTIIGNKDLKVVRTKGGHEKVKIMKHDKVNVYNPSTKKCQVATIKSVVESPANRHYARRNIMTNGTIVDTDLGKVKITSRPGQQGSVNGVLSS